MKYYGYLSITVILLFACNSKQDEIIDPLLSNRDTTVSPADNFFLHANGNWFKKNPIPASDASNGIFQTIQDTINSQIRQICETSAESNAPEGSNEQKIGDFFASGMDTLAIERQGINSILPEIKKIKGIENNEQLIRQIAHMHSMGCSPLFSFGLGQDDKISSKYALSFYQGGISLGDRDYYFNTDQTTVYIREEYRKHIEKILILAGQKKSEAKKDATVIFNIESKLAKASRKLEALRDPLKNYYKMSLSEFEKSTPNILWGVFLKEVGLNKVDTVIVRQPEFYVAVNKLINEISLKEWKTYLHWDLINTYADFLSKDFRDANFAFYATTMYEVKEQKPRWEKIVTQTDHSLGELIGQVYVRDYLPKGTKEKLLEIGNSIRKVYMQRIKKLAWMSASTKKKALHKLAGMTMKVGYPDKWKDMSSLKITRKSYCANVMRVNEWEFKHMIGKYGKKVDKSEWVMYPQTYNAYYDPSNNEIAVPACNIIVPGFGKNMPDDAVLYGIIGGSTFGHEMTHGFDDQGSLYDEKGNLNNWWTEEDMKKFTERTQKIVDQFNDFKVLKSKHVNGEATQGENIADLGGVIMGMEAFKQTAQYKKNQKIAGMTPLQRFFLAYGYAWMVNINDAGLSNQIMTDVHAPAQFRINGPLSNIPEFYQTFGIKKGDKMYLSPEKRVAIW